MAKQLNKPPNTKPPGKNGTSPNMKGPGNGGLSGTPGGSGNGASKKRGGA